MGRKRKPDVILSPNNFRNGIAISPPGGCEVPMDHTSLGVSDASSVGTGRPFCEILREYLNLLSCDVGGGALCERLNEEAPDACFIMRRHAEDKSTGSFVGMSEASVEEHAFLVGVGC